VVRQRWWLVVSALAVLGCGSDAADGHRRGDAAIDAVAVDSTNDIHSDEPRADTTTIADAGGDDASDAAHDSGSAADGGGTGGDAEIETAPDRAPDATTDAGRDASTDGTRDAIADVATDATPDAPSWRPCQPASRWFDLPYPVEAAAYTRVLDLLVALPATDRTLHIVDPESCSDRAVDLPRRGLSVALAPSGRTAAVGHDGELSIVDLLLARRTASYRISHPASEVAFDAKGRVHIYTRAVDRVLVPLLILDPATGATTSGAGGVNAGGHLLATPDGTRLFWVLDSSTTEQAFAEIDPDTGGAKLTVSGIGVCHGLFPTDDSAHLITTCGTVLDLPKAPGQLPVPHGALDGVTFLQHVDSLLSHGVVVSIGRKDLFGSSNDADVAGFVRVHTGSTFDYLKRIDLPPLVTDNRVQTPVGRYVFVRSDGSRYYVLARRDRPMWGPLADGIARLDAEATGQTVTTPIPVPAPPNYDLLPPSVTVPITSVPLAFDVVDVAYSRSLDRLVVVSSSPTSAVLLVDPETGTAETLATPASPSKVFVRADGAVAGVVRSGGVTFLSLQTGASLGEQATTATRVAFGANPLALVGADGDSALSWIDFAAGTRRSAFSAFFGAVAFATVPGTQSFYTAVDAVTSRPLARHEDVATGADPSVDLSMFTPDSNVVPSCGGRVWTSDDGTRLILDCGRTYRLSRTPAQDLVYAGGLDGIVAVADVAYAGPSDRFFVLPSLLLAGETYFSQPGVVTVHDGDALVMRALIDLQATPNTPTARIRPLRVFLGPTPHRLYVLAVTDFQPVKAVVLTVDVSGL
jgi:hypothetical protein